MDKETGKSGSLNTFTGLGVVFRACRRHSRKGAVKRLADS